jgi:ABC-type protease/lipase transport system fused ATPase/permease subunit
MSYIKYAHKYSETLTSMSMVENVYIEWIKFNNILQLTQSRIAIINTIFIEIYKLFRFIVQIFNLSLGAYLMIKGYITSGVIIASSYTIAKTLHPFENIANFIRIFLTVKGAYLRINKLMINHNKYIKNIFFPLNIGEIRVENIYFHFSKNKEYIIKNISFNLNNGEILTITGDVATGKTILIKLLLGLYNTDIGKITIDGVNLNLIDKSLWGKKIGYVADKNELLPTSIKKNISKLRFHLDYKKIITASKIAGSHHMILKLKQGYNTNIDNIKLSSGQKKTIALARAFYDKPKIVLFDEPENSLDFKLKENFITSIFAAKKINITTIIVTKNITLLSVSDKTLVLKNGKTLIFGKSNYVLHKTNINLS